jgi:Tol biopolymer transport system component
VVHTSAGLSHPTWSPDGDCVAFFAGERVDEEWQPSRLLIWRYGAASAYELVPDWEVPLQDHRSWTGVMGWSPDSQSVITYRTGTEGEEKQRELWLLPLQGEPQRIAPDLQFVGYPGPVSWSPQGDKFAFAAGSEEDISLWVYEVSSATLRQLPEESQPLLDRTPAWSPRGDWIAYVVDQQIAEEEPGEEEDEERQSPPGHRREVVLVRPDGSARHSPTAAWRPDERFSFTEVSWDPSGEWLVVFSSRRRPPGYSFAEAFLFRPDGSETRSLIVSSPEDMVRYELRGSDTFRWDPTGQFVAFRVGREEFHLGPEEQSWMAAEAGLVGVYDLQADQWQPVAEALELHSAYVGPPAWSPGKPALALQGAGQETPGAAWRSDLYWVELSLTD